jgi:hypothetical protein
MSAVSTPRPITRASRRTMADGPVFGARSRRCRRAFSIAVICSRTTARRARSRRNSASVLVGRGTPSAARSVSSCCAARRSSGLKPRIPSRASVLFMRLMMRVRSPTRFSRSRLGRLASSSSSVGIAAMPQCLRSPRSQPSSARSSIAASSRSVFARLCSRGTGMLVGWMTCASIPRDRSHRANQKPSRPAS